MKIIFVIGIIIKRIGKLIPSFPAVLFLLITAITLSCDQTPSLSFSLPKGGNSLKFPVDEDQKSVEYFAAETREIIDAMGRVITIPEDINKVICSGSGCLRMLTYLDAHDCIVAVDGIEVKGAPVDARPYAIANPQFKKLPVFGEFRGYDNPELIAGLNPGPEVIFKMRTGGGTDPDILQKKTDIPVVTLNYGNLTYNREVFYKNLRLMAEVANKQQRAEDVITYIEDLIEDLKARTSVSSKISCYVGGLAQSGPHGIQSTDPSYAPFIFLGIKNVAEYGLSSNPVSYMNVAKEQIIVWDPDVIFIDISTLRLGAETNALEQLRRDPSLRELSAVKKNQIYGLFPNFSYNMNIEVVLANAYFIGKIIYPHKFGDIDPFEKAEEISVFLNGGPSFVIMNQMFGDAGFTKISL